MVVLIIAASVFGLWVALAVGTKRLHDRDKSGWWLVLFTLVPAMLGAIGDSSEGAFGMAVNLIGVAISIWGFAEFGILKGTTGPNSYGPDPLPPEAPS